MSLGSQGSRCTLDEGKGYLEKVADFSSEIVFDEESIFLLLTGIGDEIYSTVDACNTANEMWTAIESYFSLYNFYQAPKTQRSNTTSTLQDLVHLTKTKGKEIAKPVTPQSESVSDEDSDPEQAQRDKDMQKNWHSLQSISRSSTNLPTTTFELLQTPGTRLKIPHQGEVWQIPYDTSDPANRFYPNREDTVTLEKESRSKLNKDTMKPYDYTYQNSLYEIFKLPSKTYLDQLERAKEVRKTMVEKRHLLGVNHSTSVSRPQLKSYQVKDKVVLNNKNKSGCKPKPRNCQASMSSRVPNKDVHLGEHRKQKPFLKFNELQCPTCKKCLYSANHDECVLEYLSRLNHRASAQNKDAKSHKTTKRYMPVEKSSASKKPER
ncbi:hypothetical protein Tco_0483827 [Tanacetum coccineum]